MSRTNKDRKLFNSFTSVSVPEGVSLWVVGDIHEHPEQFYKMLEKASPSTSRWLVSLGDVYEKGYGEKAAEGITNTLMDLQKDNICYAVRGNHELKLIRKNKKNKLTEQLSWWRQQPLVLSFNFARGKKVTILHAGVTPKMTEQDLGSDIEVVYVRDVDSVGKMIPLVWKIEDGEKVLVKAREGGKPWHELYDGRFGYIISGHNGQKDGIPKFFSYSCNIDTAIYETGILTAQIVDQNGNLGETITTTGVSKNPELNVRY